MQKLPEKAVYKTALLACAALAVFIFGLFPDAVLRLYSEGIYPAISSSQRWFSRWFPFAIGDILYTLLVVLAIIQLFRFARRAKKVGLNRADKWLIPLYLFRVALILYLSFKILWGLNYSRPSISSQLQITDQKYTVKELVSLGDFFMEQVNGMQKGIKPNLSYSIAQLENLSRGEYLRMSQKNRFFSYQQAAVKPVLSNWLVSKIGIEGYYNPLSGEANINTALPAWILPFVTCHEVAHQLGVAREDEANLVAYLVGINSEDINVRYSVNYNMLRYILFEIRFKSPEDYLKMRDRLDPGILANFKAESDFWKRYNGQMSNYMGFAFDKFLKLNNQKRGIKSYQNIVVWLWNLHRHEIKSRLKLASAP